MRYCTKCGNENNDSNSLCGHCGEDFSHKIVKENVMSNSNNGIQIFSLVGFITGSICWFINLWGIVGIIAIIFSVLGLNKRVLGASKVSAIIGMVSGIINVLFNLIIICFIK